MGAGTARRGHDHHLTRYTTRAVAVPTQTGLYGPRTGGPLELSLNHTVFADVLAGARKKFAIVVPPQAPELADGGCISITLTCMNRAAGACACACCVCVLCVRVRAHGSEEVRCAARLATGT